MNEQDSQIPARLWDVILRLTVPVVGALCATIIYHEVRLSVIEGNRFTQEDGHVLDEKIRIREDVMRIILNEIRRDVAVIREKVESREKVASAAAALKADKQ